MARGLKGLRICINIGKNRKQSQLTEKYIVVEFDKRLQLELRYLKIRLKLTSELRNIVG